MKGFYIGHYKALIKEFYTRICKTLELKKQKLIEKHPLFTERKTVVQMSIPSKATTDSVQSLPKFQ